MASTSSPIAQQDESGIAGALEGIFTKTDVVVEAPRSGNHKDVVLVQGGSAQVAQRQSMLPSSIRNISSPETHYRVSCVL